MPEKFVKKNQKDRIWWVNEPEGGFGAHEFSFDQKKIFNLFRDYPNALTAEEKEIFDAENPYWVSFFNNTENKG